jgi:hypothetical protein
LVLFIILLLSFVSGVGVVCSHRKVPFPAPLVHRHILLCLSDKRCDVDVCRVLCWSVARYRIPSGVTAPNGPGPHTYLGFTITHTTLGRTPLDEGSARRRDLYLTTHNAYNRQAPIPPAGFEPRIPASERPKTPRPLGSTEISYRQCWFRNRRDVCSCLYWSTVIFRSCVAIVRQRLLLLLSGVWPQFFVVQA